MFGIFLKYKPGGWEEQSWESQLHLSGGFLALKITSKDRLLKNCKLRCLEAIHTQMSSVSLPFLVRLLSVFKQRSSPRVKIINPLFALGFLIRQSTIPFWPLACYHLYIKETTYSTFCRYKKPDLNHFRFSTVEMIPCACYLAPICS